VTLGPQAKNIFLNTIADRPTNPAKFLILGSASRELIQQSSESLAGRIRHIEVTPFQLAELSTADGQQLWMRGGFPRSFNADTDEMSWIWRKEYVRTYLEQDLPNLGLKIPPQHMRRFWTMLAHFHGQIFNASTGTVVPIKKSLEPTDFFGYFAKSYQAVGNSLIFPGGDLL
jgi:predicted AAA+ superfamily ATPase